MELNEELEVITNEIKTISQLQQEIGSGTVSYTNVALSGEELIWLSKSTHADLTFSDCHFQVGININLSGKRGKMSFRSCKFDKGIQICDKADTVEDDDPQTSRRSISFSDCKANSGITIRDCKQINNIDIVGLRAPGRIEIEGIDFVEIDSSVLISASNLLKVLKVTNVNGLEKLELRHDYCRQIDIGECRVNSITLNNVYALEGSDLPKPFKIAITGKAQLAHINQSSFNAPIQAIFAEVQKLEVIQSAFHKASTIEANGSSTDPQPDHKWKFDTIIVKESLEVKCMGGKIAGLAYHGNHGNEGELLFAIHSCKQFKLSGTSRCKVLQFKHLREIKEFVIEDFQNQGTLIFNQCGTDGGDATHGSIKESNLGGAQFVACSLGGFKVWTIEKSLVSGIEVSGMPKFGPKQLHPLANDKDSSRARREVYRQLKVASERQGNRIQALEFHAEEMKAYRKQLMHSWKIMGAQEGGLRQVKAIIKSFCTVHASDRFILFIGRLNSHGQNWFLPLLFVVLLTGLVFYPAMVVAGSERLSFGFNFSSESWQETWEEMKQHLPAFWQLFNPARFIRRVWLEAEGVGDTTEVKLSHWFYFWDGFQRIVLALFIYQIITAFRKYVRGGGA